MEFFLHRPAGFWEQVDEYTFKNWKQAMNEKGDGQRYSGNRIVKSGAEVEFTATTKLTPRDFAFIARFTGAGADLSPNLTIPGGIVREPEFVQFNKISGGHPQTILKKMNGPTFVAKAA